MILSMADQVYTFLYVAGIGFAVGFFYDFLRLFRKFVKHSAALCNIQDAVYWMLVLVFTFYFMLNRFYGEIRLFSVLGFFLGMILYFATISRAVLSVLSLIWRFIAKVLSAFIKIITYPIKVLVRILRVPAALFLSFFGKFNKKTKKVLHKSSRYARIRTKKLKRDLRIIAKRV